MHYNKKIPLEQGEIQLIIKSFEDGHFEYSENYREHPTVTQNGRGAAIWNNINTQLVKNFSMPGFRTNIISRGPWDLVYLFDENTKYLYTFMREATFNDLHKGNMQDKVFHYTNILGRLNGELLGTYTPLFQQYSFAGEVTVDVDTDSQLELLLKTITSSIDDCIDRYAIVLVDMKCGTVNHIECVIPIANKNPMYREDWSKYISAEYTTESYHVEETMPDYDDGLYLSNADINLSVRGDNIEKEA